MEEETSNVVQQIPAKQDIAIAGENREQKVALFLDSVFPAIGNTQDPISAIVPWLCDVLLSEESLKAYSSDLKQFASQMETAGY